MPNFGPLKRLSNQMLHLTESIIYTTSASKLTEVSCIWMHNPTVVATVQNATIWFPVTASQVTGSFSASAALQRLNEGLSASFTLEISPKVPFVLDGALSEKITAKCTQTSSINIIIFGREEV
jgi:hypothetical protein